MNPQTEKMQKKCEEKKEEKKSQNPKIVKNGQQFRQFGKISKNLKNPFFQKKFTILNILLLFFFCQKKSYPLSFPILGGRDSTRALQSSPLQNPGGVVRA